MLRDWQHRMDVRTVFLLPPETQNWTHADDESVNRRRQADTAMTPPALNPFSLYPKGNPMQYRSIFSAIALSVAASSALAAGADGPSFPDLNRVEGVSVTRAQVQAELAQAPRTSNELFRAPTGDTNVTDNVPVNSTRTRAEVIAELRQPVRVGQIGNAH